MLNRAALLAVLTALGALPTLAATHIWTGTNSTLMSDAANWTGGSPAGDAAADLSFPAGADRLDIVNDIAGLSVTSLSISGIGYSIGGNAITLLNARVSDSTGGPNRITSDLVLAGDATFVTELPDPYHDEGLTLFGQVRGSGSLIKLGASLLILSGRSPNTYSGDTRVRDGELRLAKQPGVNAVPGNVFVESTAANNENGHLVAIASEQVPDTATITITVSAEATFAAVETIGPLVIQSGGAIGTVAHFGRGGGTSTGTLILGGDITLTPYSSAIAYITGDIVLPDIRVITASGGGEPSVPRYGLKVDEVRGMSGTSGLLIRADGTGGSISVDGTYEGPTIIDGPVVSLDNPRTATTLKSGRLNGTARSIHAQRGQVSQLVAKGDLRLDRQVTLKPEDARAPALTADSSVTIDGATLVLDSYAFTRELGKTHMLVLNKGTAPVNGTFAGVPEGSVLKNVLQISYVGGDGNDVILKQVGKYSSYVQTMASDDNPPSGNPVTIRASIFSLQTSTPITGSVTFRLGSTVLAVVPVANNSASATVSLPWGYQRVIASYSGNDVIAPSEQSHLISVSPPKPTITSISPDNAPSGAEVTITIRGTDFLPGGRVGISSTLFTPTYVSSSELRIVWDIPLYDSDRTWSLEVVQPQPGVVRSNQVPFRIVGQAPPSPDLTFDATGVEGRVTPGASATWFFIVQRAPYSVVAGAAIVDDTNNDGTVRLPYNNPLATWGTFTMVDMTAGTILAASPHGQPRKSAFPSKALLRDPSGNYSQVAIEDAFWENFVLVRPGVGAWEGFLFGDGEPQDLDGAFNDITVFNLSAMTPIGGSPAPPAGVAPGDVFLGMDYFGEDWFGERIDMQLTETIGPGVVFFARGGSIVGEKKGVVRLTLMRTEGTDGAVSVKYTTVDDSALAGTHYLPTAGTVTFGPGEILKIIEIPIVDDAVYSGNTKFTVKLSDPAGTTIKAPAASVVSIEEDDPAPKVTVASAEVQEGDLPDRHVTLDVTLTGPTRIPATLPWSWQEGGGGPSRPGGTLLFQPGETRKTVTVPYDGDAIPGADRFLIVYVASFGDSAATGLIRIIDDDISEVSALDVSVPENVATIRVPVRSNVASARPIVLTYRTVDGTATAGVDYTAATGKVTLEKPDSLQQISVPIRNDGETEGDEWFMVEITEATNSILRRSFAIVTILDDETPAIPVLAGADALTTEYGTARFPFYLSSPLTRAMSFRAKTASASALEGVDYSALDSVITIPAGGTEATVEVRIISDSLYEGAESFSLTLSEVTEATAPVTTFSATIFDDDGDRQPIVTTSDIEVTEGQSGSAQVTFVVKLASAATTRVLVRYATRDETATAPGDYAPLSGALTFEPGQTAKSIVATVSGDTLAEYDETFELVLESADAFLDRAIARCTILNDDGAVPRRRTVRH